MALNAQPRKSFSGDQGTPDGRRGARDFKLDPEFKTRYRVLDFPGGGVLVIGIHTRDGGFGDRLALAEPIVATLTIQR